MRIDPSPGGWWGAAAGPAVAVAGAAGCCKSPSKSHIRSQPREFRFALWPPTGRAVTRGGVLPRTGPWRACYRAHLGAEAGTLSRPPPPPSDPILHQSFARHDRRDRRDRLFSRAFVLPAVPAVPAMERTRRWRAEPRRRPRRPLGPRRPGLEGLVRGCATPNQRGSTEVQPHDAPAVCAAAGPVHPPTASLAGPKFHPHGYHSRRGRRHCTTEQHREKEKKKKNFPTPAASGIQQTLHVLPMAMESWVASSTTRTGSGTPPPFSPFSFLWPLAARHGMAWHLGNSSTRPGQAH